MILRSAAVLMALLLPLAAEARKQNAPPRQAGQPNAKAPQGFRGEFFANLDDVEQKLVALAESTPAEKFAWRPGNGIRSISEVYMHIAGGNYFLATFLGAQPPKMNGDLEKAVKAKAEVIAELRRSFDHLRNSVNATSDLEKPVKMFGKQTTNRGVMVTMLSHLHEHLGQSIAYARMNSIAPPWSH